MRKYEKYIKTACLSKAWKWQHGNQTMLYFYNSKFEAMICFRYSCEMWLNMWHPAFLYMWDPAFLVRPRFLSYVRPCGRSGLTGGSFALASSERSQNIQIVGTPSNILIFTQFLLEIDLARAWLASSRQGHPHDLLHGPSSFEKGGLVPVIGFQCSTTRYVTWISCWWHWMWRGARTLPSSGDFYYHAVEYKGSMVSFKKLIDGQPLPGVCVCVGQPPRLTWITKNIQLAYINIYWLVVWNMIFPYIENVIIPTDLVIFFRGVGWNHQPVYIISRCFPWQPTICRGFQCKNLTFLCRPSTVHWDHWTIGICYGLPFLPAIASGCI